MQKAPASLYQALVQAIAFAAGIFILLWFLYTVLSIVLLLLLAIVVAISINAPVTRLEQKNIRRLWAALLVFFILFLVIGLLGWLIIPKIMVQLKTLILDLPLYTARIQDAVSGWLKNFPGLVKEPSAGTAPSGWTFFLPGALWRIGGYSISLIGSVLLVIVFISIVAYMVIDPRPMVELYLSLFSPPQRDKAQRAFIQSSIMIIGWMRSNLIGGFIEAVCVVLFLSLMHVPGAWVWGALTFFAEMIPRIGFYIMAVPPVLVSLSISAMTAVWVAVFFLILAEIVGDFIMPRLRSSTMNLHPVSVLFVLLAMGAAFGFVGILLATPVAAIIKAFYEEFYLGRFEEDAKMESRIDSIIYVHKKT